MTRRTLTVKAVIFDMDGVITNTMPDHYRAWKIVLRKFGLNVNYYDIYTREGQTGIHSLKEIFAAYGMNCSDRQLRQIVREKEILFKKIVRTRFIPGARSFIRALCRRRIRLALVTGTSRHELHEILPSSIYRLFEVTVTGSDVKKGKPDPEPYRRAIRHLKIQPRDAVAIENAPLGIRSARKAGLECLALETSLPKSYLHETKFVFKSFDQLCRKIRFQLKCE
ncbi:MAG: HAD family phosphatase [Candidatus Omnitrophota bacterium]